MITGIVKTSGYYNFGTRMGLQNDLFYRWVRYAIEGSRCHFPLTLKRSHGHPSRKHSGKDQTTPVIQACKLLLHKNIPVGSSAANARFHSMA